MGETWIGVPHDYPFDRVLSQLVAATGEPVRIAQRFNDNGIVEALVAAGHGIAILPRFTTREHGNGLVTRPLVGIRAHREITAVLRPDRFERPRALRGAGAARRGTGGRRSAPGRTPTGRGRRLAPTAARPGR